MVALFVGQMHGDTHSIYPSQTFSVRLPRMKHLTATTCLTIVVLLGSAGVSFALPPCPSDQNQYYDNCFGTFTFGPSSQWTGDKYVGEHRNGKRNGQGTYTFATGDKYVGEHRNGKRHGQGTFTFANGNKYVGEFRNGKFYGQGIFTFNGNKYVGEFRDGKPNGQGTKTYATGDKYVGEHRNDKRHGQGTFTFANGNKYVGEWKDGKTNGQGTYTYATGNKYVGEHRNGNRNGQGTYTFATGDNYVGEHRNDKRHGQGTFTFANGNKYVGEFRNGKFYGQGTFTIADGRIKEGFWKDNKIQYAQKGTPPVIARKSSSPTRLELAHRTQAALQVLGLYSGKLDGIIGVKTRSAMQRWQKRNGYAGTGEVTEAQLTKLEQEAITLLAKEIPKTQGRGTTTFNSKKDRPR